MELNYSYQFADASSPAKFGKRNRSPYSTNNTGNSNCEDENMNINEGSPWQAMKRLRVAEENKNYSLPQIMNKFPSWNGTPTTNKCETENHQYNVQSNQNDQVYDQSENAHRMNQSLHASYNEAQNSRPSVEHYENVNHVLGSLHQERIRRQQMDMKVGTTQECRYAPMQESNSNTPIQRIINYGEHQNHHHQSHHQNQNHHYNKEHLNGQQIQHNSHFHQNSQYSSKEERNYSSQEQPLQFQYLRQPQTTLAVYQNENSGSLRQQFEQRSDDVNEKQYYQRDQELNSRQLSFNRSSPQRKRKVVRLQTTSKLG